MNRRTGEEIKARHKRIEGTVEMVIYFHMKIGNMHFTFYANK